MKFGKHSSWFIVDWNNAIKTVDKTFLNGSTRIPQKTKAFWNITRLGPGNRKQIQLIDDNNQIYPATITEKSDNSRRLTLSWLSPLTKKVTDIYESCICNYFAMQYIRCPQADTYNISLLADDDCILLGDPDEETDLEVQGQLAFSEGRRIIVQSNKYERDPRNREICIQKYGTTCVVCGFNFAETYGELGNGFVIAHHLKPLYTVGETMVNPARDMRPVCSNCHSMLHRSRNKVISINHLKKIVNKHRSKS